MVLKRWLGMAVFALALVVLLAAGGLLGERMSADGTVEEATGAAAPNREGFELKLESADAIPRDFAWIEEGPAVGVAAPDITLPGMDGQTYRLSDWQGEKPVVVNFWASWCPPCEMEAPDLVYLSEKYKDDIVFLAVNLTNQDTLDGARSFIERHGYRFPVLLDEKGEVSRRWQVLSIPTTYFIDRNGTIQDKLYGITTRGRLDAMLQRLLEPS